MYYNYYSEDYKPSYVYADYEKSDLKDEYYKIAELNDKAGEKVDRLHSKLKRLERKKNNLWKQYCDDENQISVMLEIYADYKDLDCNKLRQKFFKMRNKREKNKFLKQKYFKTIKIVDEIYDDLDEDQYAVFLKSYKQYKKLDNQYKKINKAYKKAYREYEKINDKYHELVEEYDSMK